MYNYFYFEAPEIWSYALSSRNLQFCNRIIKGIFGGVKNSINEEIKMKGFDCTGKK